MALFLTRGHYCVIQYLFIFIYFFLVITTFQIKIQTSLKFLLESSSINFVYPLFHTTLAEPSVEKILYESSPIIIIESFAYLTPQTPFCTTPPLREEKMIESLSFSASTQPPKIDS